MRDVMIPPSIVDMLIARMGNETKTSLIYKDMAAFFDALNLNGFADYFNRESKGEEKHARLIKQYLADKQAEYRQPVISYAPQHYDSPMDVMDAYINAEKQTTSDLYDIADAALKSGDWATVSWLTAPDINDKGHVVEYGLIQYQKIELKDAYDLSMQVRRVIGPDGQIQGDGLNNIDEQLKG